MRDAENLSPWLIHLELRHKRIIRVLFFFFFVKLKNKKHDRNVCIRNYDSLRKCYVRIRLFIRKIEKLLIQAKGQLKGL